MMNSAYCPCDPPEDDYSSLVEQHFAGLVACYEKYKRAVGVICDPDYIILPPVYVVPRELVTPLRRIFF